MKGNTQSDNAINTPMTHSRNFVAADEQAEEWVRSLLRLVVESLIFDREENGGSGRKR
jgi:hypothetical protein